MKKIERRQIKIIKVCKKIFGRENQNSLFSYFAFWGDTIGYANLLFNLNKIRYFLNYTNKVFKELYFSTIDLDFELIKSSKLKIKNYKKILFVDASINDFDKKGNFTDRYFKSSPKKNPDFLYFIIYSSKIYPKKISTNIILLKYDYLFAQKYNFITNLIKLLKQLYKYKFNYKKIIDEKSITSKFADRVLKYVINEFNFNKFNKLLMSFEAQPHQIKILRYFKTKNKNIKNICYDHSAPHALPIHMYYRFSFLDKLIVNGNNQKNYLSKYLNWPLKKIKVKKSLRYQLVDRVDYKCQIFLPFNIFNKKKILDEFKFLLSLKPFLASSLKVRNHPLKTNSKNHIMLKEKLSMIIKNKKKEVKLDNKTQVNYSVFIGQTTAVIVALEKKLNVIHICDNSEFDMYSSKTWKNLNVVSISNNTFEYKLKKKGTFLKQIKNSNNKILKEYA